MPEVIRIAACPPSPWRNGAGTTRELWALRDAGGAALVRISIAEIGGAQSFSTFPETDRVILQLDGPPMVLTVNGSAHALTRTPLAFRGEDQVSCTLEGDQPAHDLNLMCRRGQFAPDMQLLETPRDTGLSVGSPAAITAVLALGPVTLRQPLNMTLDRHDLLVGRDRFTLRTAERAAFVCLTARRSGRLPA